MYKYFHWRHLHIILLLCGIMFIAAIWIFADNYYADYETIYSKLYTINVSPNNNFDAYDQYAPQAYIFYEWLWNLFYKWKPDVFWYDYTMLICFILAFMNACFACYRKFADSGFIGIVAFAVWSVFFLLWAIRMQNITHTAYLLCLSSLAGYYVSKKNLSVLPVFHLLSFIAGACIRWEVGAISTGIYLLFFIIISDKKHLLQWRYYIPLLIFCFIAIHVGYKFFGESHFYRQVEPDGEYIVLYERALRLPDDADATDSLQYALLTQWIVDDTTIVAPQIFEKYIRLAEASRGLSYYLNRVGLAFDAWKRLLVDHIVLFLPLIIIPALYRSKKAMLKMLLFIAAILLLCYLMALKSVLTGRHVEGILTGISILLLCYSDLRPYAFFVLIIVVTGIRLAEINNKVKSQRLIYEKRLKQADIIRQFTRNCTIWTDAHYPELFLNKTLTVQPNQQCIRYLSFQQHSYSERFRKYISKHFGTAQRYDVYFTRLAEEGAYVIISRSRAAAIEQLLQKHYGLTNIRLVFTKALDEDVTDFLPFSNVCIWKVEKDNKATVSSI